MDEFRTLFLRLCKEHGVDPQEGILQRIQEISAENAGFLDLSNNTLTLASCAVLGKVLAHDLAFTSVVLSDCMLSEEGAKLILNGLSKNTVVKILDLRGNNLRQTAAIALGRYLKENHSLQTLLLEWNSLGVWESAFTAFCEGVASNVTLKHLDLRNNQIDHTGAQELSLALRSNATLMTLDLRWNNVGLVGGRSLSEALQQNEGVVKIDVAGNNIPRDVLASIEASALHNEDRAHMTMEQHHKTTTLTNEIEFLKTEKKKQMIIFMDDLELAKSQLDTTNKSSSVKIGQLQVALEERKAALNALRAKLDMTEASLTLSEQKAKEQVALLELSRNENLDLAKNYESQMKREREERSKQEAKLSKELEENLEKLHEATATVSDLERRCKNQQDQILLLKENVAQLKSDHRVALSTADERLASDRHRMQMEARDLEEVRMRDVERLRLEMEDAKKAAEDRVEKMRLSREAFASEIAEVNRSMAQERLIHDDEIRELRRKLKEEENVHVNQLQEKIKSLISEKSEIQKNISTMSSDLAAAESSRSSLNIEMEGLRRTLDGVKRQLASKDSEHEAELSRVRSDLKKRIIQLEEDNAEVTSLRGKLTEIERKFAEESSAHRDVVQERDRTIERITENLRRCEADAERARDEEMRRARELQSAVLTYVQSAHRSTSPSRV
ncbi:unnamed protein product [Clavelina lepadiformis]|uniref:Leucine-rich repeat-containing protein 45 n=1 Tax=Clavelina lepadiformis TaxID=159417 RepID=A0ABP0FRZ9_CLALP